MEVRRKAGRLSADQVNASVLYEVAPAARA
jgi:hypothetical protein